MDGDVELLKRIYDRFNARDIDGVLAVLADDVAWANGMDGGHAFADRNQIINACCRHDEYIRFFRPRLADAVVMSDVRRQRGSPSTSCAVLQSRQFPFPRAPSVREQFFTDRLFANWRKVADYAGLGPTPALAESGDVDRGRTGGILPLLAD